MSYGPATRLRSSIKSKSKKTSESLPSPIKATTFQPPYHFTTDDSFCTIDPNGKCQVILKSTIKDTLSSLKCYLCTNEWDYGEGKWQCIYNQCQNTFCCRCVDKDKKTVRKQQGKFKKSKSKSKSTKLALEKERSVEIVQEAEPEHVAPITEIDNFDAICYAIHAFNSLVQDNKLRWFSQPITSTYFATEKEFADYMHVIDNNPMDFTSIKKKIYNNEYRANIMLFCDMELVFKNAMTFNKKGNIWYDEAERLNGMLLSLKNKEIMHDSSWRSIYDCHSKVCLQCNNIMLPKKSMQPIVIKCNNCLSHIKCKESNYFICHNGYHNNKSAVFCRKCVKKCVYLPNNDNNRNNPKTNVNMDGLSLISALFKVPSNLDECEYMSSIWKSMNTFSNEMIVANDKYETAISHKRKRKLNYKLTANKAPLKKQKINKNDHDPIYKIKRPQTAWMLYNVFKIKDLWPRYPSLSMCQRTKISGKLWKVLSNEKKKKWIKKAEKEKMKYVQIKQEYEKHHDFNKVPQKWKQIDKKAEKARNQSCNQQ